MSIRTRLILLSVLLLAILATSSALLIRELAHDSKTLAEEATLVSVVKNANSASKHFGDLKYWVIDSAVTHLRSSQEKAAAAEAGLESDLKAVSAVDPAFVASIEVNIDTMTELARKAGVDAAKAIAAGCVRGCSCWRPTRPAAGDLGPALARGGYQAPMDGPIRQATMVATEPAAALQ